MGKYCNLCLHFVDNNCNCDVFKVCNEGNNGYYGGKKNGLVEKTVSGDKKWDAGKPMVGLMKKDFSRALMAVADVSRFGVEKYKKPGSWREVEDALARYEDAHGRHDLLMHQEDRDKESKCLHAAHRAWNALATLEMLLEDMDEDY